MPDSTIHVIADDREEGSGGIEALREVEGIGEKTAQSVRWALAEATGTYAPIARREGAQGVMRNEVRLSERSRITSSRIKSERFRHTFVQTGTGAPRIAP